MAEKVRFTGSVRHTEETIQLLFRTEYYTYDKFLILVWMGIGFVMIAAAIMAPMNRIVQILLLMVGCWLIVSKDFPASLRAAKALEDRKSALPEHVCTFRDSGMDLDGEGHMRLQYDRFQRLIEDEGYLYLFLGRRSVCMIDKQSVKHGTWEELKSFVEKRTGLTWSWNRSLLLLNLSDIRRMLQDRKAR